MTGDCARPTSDDPLVEPIARAASELVAQAGHRDLDIGHVARRAATTSDEVTRLFPTVDHLLVAVLESRDVADILAVRTTMADRPDRTPRAVLHELVARNAAQPHLIRLYCEFAALSLDPEHPAHDYFKRRYRESADILADIVSPVTARPEQVAEQILAMMDGLELQWLRERETFDLLAAWDAAADRILT